MRMDDKTRLRKWGFHETLNKKSLNLYCRNGKFVFFLVSSFEALERISVLCLLFLA